MITESGSGTCPGYVGLTVGGGIGRYTGLFGLVLDGLLSARVVTADGRIIEVSSTQEPDLFWGLRGAGANLGIITSATYQAHRQVAGGQVMNADFIFSADKSQQYFDVLASFSGTMPAELAVVTLIFYNPEAQAVCREIPRVRIECVTGSISVRDTDVESADANPRQLGVHGVAGGRSEGHRARPRAKRLQHRDQRSPMERRDRHRRSRH